MRIPTVEILKPLGVFAPHFQAGVTPSTGCRTAVHALRQLAAHRLAILDLGLPRTVWVLKHRKSSCECRCSGTDDVTRPATASLGWMPGPMIYSKTLRCR
jgi:hypothetical protein